VFPRDLPRGPQDVEVGNGQWLSMEERRKLHKYRRRMGPLACFGVVDGKRVPLGDAIRYNFLHAPSYEETHGGSGMGN